MTDPDALWVGNPRVPDFSFAGYQMGKRQLPRPAVVTNARDFGAKGDGVADDTLALQRALEATHDGALLLLAGRYVLRDTLRFSRSRVVLRGEGPEKTVLVVPRSLSTAHPPSDPLSGKLFGFVEARGKVPELGLGRFIAARRTNPSGHHALWAKRTQDCLFSDFRIETQFEEDLTVEAFANGNVFMRGTGQAINLDHHRNAPYENLFTDLEVGSGARLWKSGGNRDRGPHAGVRETLWNVRHQGPAMALPGAADFDKRIDRGWPQLNLVRVEGYAPTSAQDNVWVEPAPEASPNLYEAQRRRRSVSP